MTVIERDSTPQELILAPDDVMTADNAPLLLTRAVQTRSVVVRYSRVERWDVLDESRRVGAGARPRQLAWAAAGGVTLGALIVMMFAGQPAASLTGTREASVTVPAAVIPAPSGAGAVPVQPVRIVVVRPAAAVAIPAAAAVPAAAVAAPIAAIEHGPQTEASALAQAFSSNEAVSWRSATAMGTVVVGAASIENGRYCRDVAILTRAENAADRTVNSRKCLEPGGRIADKTAAIPQ